MMGSCSAPSGFAFMSLPGEGCPHSWPSGCSLQTPCFVGPSQHVHSRTHGPLPLPVSTHCEAASCPACVTDSACVQSYLAVVRLIDWLFLPCHTNGLNGYC
jgi:hypothetical protein